MDNGCLLDSDVGLEASMLSWRGLHGHIASAIAPQDETSAHRQSNVSLLHDCAI